jgi:hypothetical protein
MTLGIGLQSMSTARPLPEAWLRGPIEGIDPALMPAAHALLQTMEDVEREAAGLTLEQLWASPGGAASIGFHLLHLSGSTDRLLTYARGAVLDDAQKAALSAERNPPRTDAATLLAALRTAIRAALPTTVMGLIFHAAEHSQRHAGQVVTTAKIIRAQSAGA